jgi:hypothetical protein
VWTAFSKFKSLGKSDTEGIAEENNNNNNNNNNNSGCLAAFRDYYKMWSKTNGKYFIIKTYISEIFEYLSQILSIDIYNCNYPIGTTLVFYIIFLVEALVVFNDTIITIRTGVSVTRRNNKLMTDTIVDSICATLPLVLSYFVYSMEFSEYEFFMLGEIPAFFTLIKLSDVVEATITERSATYEKILLGQARESVLKFANSWKNFEISKSENLKVEELQSKNTPRVVHFGFGFVGFMYSIFLVALIIVQFASYDLIGCNQTFENKYLWQHCQIKVKYCQNLFSPQCDCAILNIPEHNLTKLPDSLLQMHALKILKVNNGPLLSLQSQIGTSLVKLNTVNFKHNKLQYIPESFGKSKSLFQLILNNNNITNLPLDIWRNNNMQILQVNNNNLLEIPNVIMEASMLWGLGLNNNSISTLPFGLFKTNIVELQLSGNRLTNLPNEISQLHSLKYLELQNQAIKSIPEEIGLASKLVTIDIRNNSVELLPNNIHNLQHLEYLYLYGNPLCSKSNWFKSDAPKETKGMIDSVSGRCDKHCSPYCTDDQLQQTYTCFDGCNSPQCNFQNGVCTK